MVLDGTMDVMEELRVVSESAYGKEGLGVHELGLVSQTTQSAKTSKANCTRKQG